MKTTSLKLRTLALALTVASLSFTSAVFAQTPSGAMSKGGAMLPFNVSYGSL